MGNDVEGKLITIDARRRVSLMKVGNPEHRFYMATVDDDGTITLTPVHVVPARTLDGDHG